MHNAITSDPVIIEPKNKVEKVVLWMHGLGADGNDFVPIVGELGLNPEHGIRFIFPQAPVIPVTINSGMKMRAWYDIVSIDGGSRELDYRGVEASTKAVIDIMEQQYRLGIAWNNMVVAGFSQGGVIASSVALACKKPIAGLMCLSSYFPFDNIENTVEQIPAFVAHGRMDGIVPYGLGEECRQQLAAAGFVVEFHSYNMEHNVCPEELNHINKWLHKVL